MARKCRKLGQAQALASKVVCMVITKNLNADFLDCGDNIFNRKAEHLEELAGRG